LIKRVIKRGIMKRVRKKIKGCRRDDMDKDDEEEYKRHDDQWKIRVA